MKTKYIVGLIMVVFLAVGMMYIFVRKQRKNTDNKDLINDKELEISASTYSKNQNEECLMEKTREDVIESMNMRTEEAKKTVRDSFEEMKKNIDSIEKQKSEMDNLLIDLKS